MYPRPKNSVASGTDGEVEWFDIDSDPDSEMKPESNHNKHAAVGHDNHNNSLSGSVPLPPPPHRSMCIQQHKEFPVLKVDAVEVRLHAEVAKQ